MRPRRIIINLLVYGLALFFAVACGGGREKARTLEGAFPVDPLFQKFYDKLGGEAVIGPAISSVFEDQETIYQYTMSALLVYDPRAAEGEKLHLAPLGREMGIDELSAREAEFNGAGASSEAIDKKILPLYQKLGGGGVVGDPLTKVHLNEEKKRYEQYFENVGFFWVAEDPQAEVQLLAYGAWKCDRYCRHKTPLNSRISLPTRKAAPFVRIVTSYGLEFTGFALSEPYLGADGNLEQIYENLVMQASPAAPEIVRLLPLPEKLDIQRDILLPADPSGEMYFFEVQGGLGYSVPAYFIEYIRKHGGLDFIGQPITHLAELDGKLFRQCFLNMCLKAVQSGEGERQVSPEALGIRYRDVYYQPAVTPAPDENSQDITFQLWEGFPMVSPEQEQEIGVAVFSNGIPLADIEPELDLLLPSGVWIHNVMPPTNENGESQMMIDPLDVDNGTLIPYKVCVNTPKGQRFCLMDSYLIWKADFITISPRLPPGNTSYLPFVVKNFQAYVPAVLENFEMYLPFVTSKP